MWTRARRRIVAYILGREKPPPGKIDPKVRDAALWMEEIRREQFGAEGGEIVRALVVVEVLRQPGDQNSTVVYSSDRSDGYASSVQVQGMLAEAQRAHELIQQAAVINMGLRNVSAWVAERERELDVELSERAGGERRG